MRAMRLTAALAFFLSLLGAPSAALACAVCFGDPNSLMAKGSDAGVLFLLCVITTVLTMFASLFLYWMRRSRMNRLSVEGMVH